MSNVSTHAAEWTPEQIQKWKNDYLAVRPVVLPLRSHEPGECGHCDLLRQWAREADETEE